MTHSALTDRLRGEDQSPGSSKAFNSFRSGCYNSGYDAGSPAVMMPETGWQAAGHEADGFIRKRKASVVTA
jgi:hypothetical protein